MLAQRDDWVNFARNRNRGLAVAKASPRYLQGQRAVGACHQCMSYVFSSEQSGLGGVDSRAASSSAQSAPVMSLASATAPIEDEGAITEMAYLRWKTELQNRLIVEQEKRLHDQRKAYKFREDSKFWERKQNLHAKTVREFHHCNEMVDQHHAANAAKGSEYKQDLDDMRKMIAQQKEEWRQFGHELTVQHGTEQGERTKARISESFDEKQEQGREVKKMVETQNQHIQAQRSDYLERKVKYVEEKKAEKIGKLEESLRWMYEQKKGMVSAVRKIEDKWKALTKYERNSFLHHAHDNHNAVDLNKEHMRSSRKDLIKKNRAAALTERTKKEADAVAITEKKEKYEQAKRAMRDATYSARYASPEKSKVMRQANRSPSPQKAARDAGLIEAPEVPDPASPYRLT